MSEKLSNLWRKDGTKSVASSLISILVGLAVGAIVGIVLNAVLPGKDYEFGSDLQGDTSVNFIVQ